MSTKYGGGIDAPARWRLAGEDRPHFSQHALERWDERTPEHAVAPETAWEQAVGDTWLADHPHFERGHQSTERVRIYHGENWGVALIVENTTVVTVLRLYMLTPPLRAYCFGLREVADDE